MSGRIRTRPRQPMASGCAHWRSTSQPPPWSGGSSPSSSGAGIFAIAEELTRDGIPCPSAHDPGRNRHRCGIAWSKGAVRAILLNPRYTGRQVWNRQRKDEVLIDVNDVALGYQTKMRCNNAGRWIWSDEITHPPVISADTFQQAQDILAARGRGPCQHKPHDRQRGYAFTGSLFCGVCERRMQGHWINAAPYYRCRFPGEYALANKVSHPRNVYLRQDAFDAQVNDWLAAVFAPARLTGTIDQIMAGQAGRDRQCRRRRGGHGENRGRQRQDGPLPGRARRGRRPRGDRQVDRRRQGPAARRRGRAAPG